MTPTRRDAMLAVTAGVLAAPRAGKAAPPPALRLGTVQAGAVQWIAAVIRERGLDRAHGFSLTTQTLATVESSKVALLSQAVDVSVSDWPFVALQRLHGRGLTFVPLSAALGGVMVRPGSPVRGLADLAGRRLGVAGGPSDKSWLLVQAAARAQSVPLDRVELAFAAPPLLSAKLGEGALDAALTFWTFCAKLEAIGDLEPVSVADCARALGLGQPPALVGWVFDERWASRNAALLAGFLAAARAAVSLLRRDDAAWATIRPLMGAETDAVATALRRRFVNGLRAPDPETQTREAASLVAVALRVGGPDAMGGVSALPKGTFWQDGRAATNGQG